MRHFLGGVPTVAPTGGGSPIISDSFVTTSAAATTAAVTFTVPASRANGDLLVAIVRTTTSSGGTIRKVGSAWATLATATYGIVCSKVSDGTETVTDSFDANGASERLHAIVLVVQNASWAEAAVADATFDPPNLAPAGGNGELWISGVGRGSADSPGGSITFTPPANYPAVEWWARTSAAGSGTLQGTLVGSSRSNTAASENPGLWATSGRTQAGSAQFAYTIGIA